ncbi:MAG: hypothetical protein LBM07_07320 [Culturomica sp.]|jgi:hypothetical protein|nr:hypothetical protein [Culturomica sp.]
MPYRRLPNTDAARIRALKTALKKSRDVDDINTMAYPLSLRQRVDIFLPKFETAIVNSKSARDKQIQNSKVFAESIRKARLYISHFIQVLNFTIARGELKSTARVFYGLDENETKLPSLQTETELLNWGEKVINGEQDRLNSRVGNPIYSPNIAIVKVNFENFKQNYEYQKRLQANSARYSQEVAQFRAEADSLITEVWNDVELHFENVKDEEQKRYMCEEYGLVYVFRRGEKERIKRLKEAEEITLKFSF